ncbi:MAG: thymidine phosphorylase family protein [Pseudomonadales bacterium]|jgi:thymidine phosphorylase|nr:thymidine phosphorylase family protein [Pseudomonadales bacterium]
MPEFPRQSVPTLKARRLGIDTHHETVVFMRSDCHVCRAEGFSALNRIHLTSSEGSIIATLNVVHGDLLEAGEIGLSESSWQRLGVNVGDRIEVSHARPLDSFSFVRAKIFGGEFTADRLQEIMSDITAGRYSDVHLSSFVTACTSEHLNTGEIIALTDAMVKAGDRLGWDYPKVMDKHCVGGLPGNRTTPIVVAIVAAAGLVMPKTSSRAITSPAGTADTMEVLAPVDLTLNQMRKVVDQEGGCIVWGGAVSLSPADDILIRVERALELDSEAQLIASVLSKKIAAGSSHVLVDIPVGPTAKVRDHASAIRLSNSLNLVGEALGIKVQSMFTDGHQPIGYGIGPSLEARDVLNVLQNKASGSGMLRDRALDLAGAILEMAGQSTLGSGRNQAKMLLESGKAWQKFQAICEAQGGMREPVLAKYTHEVVSGAIGHVEHINNRYLSRLAKLAGAPADKAAGIEMHVRIGKRVEIGEPLFTIHAESPGELGYAMDFLAAHPGLMIVEEEQL